MDAPDPPTDATLDGGEAAVGPETVSADLGGVEMPEVVEEVTDSDEQQPAIKEPARVMRIGAMIRQLREEVHEAPLDEASRGRLREIYETSIRELGSALSPDLVDELERMTSPFASEAPSESELRIAQAQLVGWLEGLFQGMQAMLFAQQMAAQAQLQEMRQGELPPGAPGAGPERPGVYL